MWHKKEYIYLIYLMLSSWSPLSSSLLILFSLFLFSNAMGIRICRLNTLCDQMKKKKKFGHFKWPPPPPPPYYDPITSSSSRQSEILDQPVISIQQNVLSFILLFWKSIFLSHSRIRITPRLISPWQKTNLPATNKLTVCRLPKENKSLNGWMAIWIFCIMIYSTSHNKVTMVVADNLAPIWHQDICSYHDNVGRLVYKVWPSITNAINRRHRACGHNVLLQPNP